MNFPSFPDLKAEIEQAALRSPRTWLAPLVILLLLFSGRVPLPEVAALLFISIVAQLVVWYRQWPAFKGAARRRILEKHSKQFENELAREIQKERSKPLERALKSYQTIAAGNCRNEQLSSSDLDVQQQLEEQIQALAEIVCSQQPDAQAPAREIVETALSTMERLAALRQQTQALRVKQGLAAESELVESPLDKLKRASEQLQHRTDVEEEMERLISRVKEPSSTEVGSPNAEPPVTEG